MRILAVRGANLASLAGEFAIDFTADPFDRTGLFAITGPTGAGKSTILDAISIALYDRTPRLGKGGGPLIGQPGDETRLSGNDVRSLLRRGAGDGYAEVDFRGTDGRGYRARWEVRRARNSATGRFQNQSLTLRELESGQPLGGTRTETLDLIAARIGLTYDQFCRSLLLAQGEFAAFLKADGRERAELLERITGTDIYSRISVAAFRKARHENEALEFLTRQRDAIPVLGIEEVTALAAACMAAEQALRDAKDRHARLKQAEAWYGQRNSLVEAVSRADADLAAATAAWNAAASLRLEVADVETAQPLRHLVASRVRAHRDLAETVKELGKQRADLEAAREERDRRQAELAEARELLDAALRTRDEAEPLLIQTRDLDVRLTEAGRQVAAATDAAERADAEFASAAETLAAAVATRTAAERGRDEAAAWLEQNQPLEPVGKEWERWYKVLGQASERLSRLSALSVDRTNGDQELAEARETLSRRQEDCGRAEVLLIAAGHGVLAAEEAARTCDPAAIRQERDAEQARLDRWRELQALAGEASRLATAATTADVDAATAEENAHQAQAEAAAAETDRGKVAVARVEAERAFHLAQAARSLVEHRRELRSGEPCPLCGAVEHPWADEAAETAVITAGQEGRVKELRAEETRLNEHAAKAAERNLAGIRECTQARSKAAGFRENLLDTTRHWQQQVTVSGTDLPADPAAAGVPGRVAGLIAASGAALDRLRLQEQDAAELQRKAAEARETRDRARTELDQTVTARDVARDRAGKLELRQQALAQEIGLVTAALAETLAELEVPFAGWPGWQEEFTRKPPAFVALCTARVTEWRQQVAVRDQADARLTELAPQMEALRVGEESARKGREEKSVEVRRLRSANEILSAERQLFFGGRPVADVARELTQAVKMATATHEAAAAAVQQAGARTMTCEGTLTALEAAVTGREQAAVAAVAELHAAMSRAGFTEERLAPLLARDEEWLKGQKARLEQFRTAREQAGAVRGEREQALKLHEAAGMPTLDPDDVALALAAMATEVHDREQGHFNLRLQARTDTDNRARRADLEPLITARRQSADLWQGLNELIGSADGKKFRTYAQGLTLQVLLGYANEHLRGLAPRYRVAPVPGAEMELQMVDRDQGDELRGVNSLSGGESFLVSLALALALSSLTSATTRVESLFIDEGFGTLDQDTLDKALAVLDALQASGRQVGVISHVPGLAEKIGARIEVVPLGGGKSRIRVSGV